VAELPVEEVDEGRAMPGDVEGAHALREVPDSTINNSIVFMATFLRVDGTTMI
jgi:hypothetical protein